MGRYRDLTIRTEPCDPRYGRDVAIYLFKKTVVVYVPTRNHVWRRGKLTGVLPGQDRFRVTWSNGRYSNLKGLWRIHHACLFTSSRLPVPVKSARIQKGNKHHNPGGLSRMATTKKRVVKKAPAKKKASSNGGGTRISDLSDRERRSMAAQIKTMRKNKEPWDGDDGICAQLGLGSALQGRALLREFGGEGLIRERDGNGSSTPAKRTAKKPAAKRAAGKPTGKKKVTIKRGKGRASNPS